MTTSPDNGKRDAIVVGGGHNGLVASFYLGRAGVRTTVLERRGFVGGACATEELFEGYHISSCSYVAWMLQPKVIKDMKLRERGLHTQSIDPHGFTPYSDGSYAQWWHDDDKTIAEIARLNAHDAENYGAWNEFWHRAAGLMNHFFLSDPPTLGEMVGYAASIGESELLEKLMASSLADICYEYFEDTRVMAALAPVEDIGDPWRPGSAWTDTYFHLGNYTGLGYSVVTGGMGSITRTMAEAAREIGVEIRTDAEVERILVEDGKAKGVVLVSGEEVYADIVLSNADPKRTYLKLLASSDLDPDFRERVTRLSTEVSYLKFHSVMDKLPDLSGYLGREQDPREAGYVLIAPSLEHFRKAYEQSRDGHPASEPIVHIQVPTVYDETLTEREGHIVSIWALYAPPKLAEGTWDERRDEVGNALIDYVSEFIPNFRSDMKQWRLFTPYDIEQRVGMTDGNIRHLDVLPDQLLNSRPMMGSGYRTPIHGLYLCGAGTHPGGEVSGGPGHNAAHAVLRTLQR